MRFNRKTFFDGYRKEFGSLKQEHVQNLDYLLGKFEASAWFSADVRRPSFALGNLYIETFVPKTGSRFAPVTEFGPKSYFNRYDIKHNPRKAKDLGNLEPGDGFKYRGRGYCQITGKTNYAKFDIADEPEKALEPDTAFYILERGIRFGVFTGKSLGTYLTATSTDYVNARRVINGQDRAKEIAGYARSFEKILTSAAASQEGVTAGADEQIPDDIPSPVGGNQLSSRELPPGPTDAPGTSETTAQTVVKKVDEDTAVASTTTQSQNVAVGKEEQVGFFKQIWKEVAGWTIFQGGLQTLQSYKESIDAMGLPGWIIAYIIIAACVGMFGWFLYRVAKYLLEWWGKRSRTNVLAQVNSTPTNQVLIVPADELEQYEKQGWIVIRR